MPMLHGYVRIPKVQLAFVVTGAGVPASHTVQPVDLQQFAALSETDYRCLFLMSSMLPYML